ncbi:MAG: GvpL/GvpF family gas vesicle protein, partial [Streptosporangiales bacterium]|nr:GvpL/GvpF family gas vesicle protein [Streptosporangiales bacterium]
MSAGTGVAERADVGDVPDTLYYLYGVTHAGTKLPDVDGVGAMRPRLVESDGLALLAGDVPPGITVATRENLLAHGHLLDAVAQRSTVLPMRFGMLVEDLDAVSADMLTARRDEYLAQLDELDGAVQFSLRATYDEDVVLAEILAEDDEIRQLNEATRG